MEESDDYLKENDISYEFIPISSTEQNWKGDRVNLTFIGPVQAIFAQHMLSKSL